MRWAAGEVLERCFRGDHVLLVIHLFNQYRPYSVSGPGLEDTVPSPMKLMLTREIDKSMDNASCFGK